MALPPLFENPVELTTSVSDIHPEERFYVIPGNNGPRWIIPCNPRHGMPALQHWHPWDLSSRFKWSIIQAVYRSGQLAHLPGVKTIGIQGSSLSRWAQLTGTENTNTQPSIYLGTPGETSKVITILVDTCQFRACSILKSPIGKVSAKSIRHEAETLMQLNNEACKFAPQLIHFDNKHLISSQEVIYGKSFSKKINWPHLNFLKALLSSSTFTTLQQSALSLLHQVEQLPLPRSKENIELKNLLLTLDDQQSIPSARSHGDFAPWNIKRLPNNELMAFDWEFSERKSIPGLDMVHYLSSVHFLLNGQMPTANWYNHEVIPQLRRLSCFKNSRDHLLNQVWKYYIAWYLMTARKHESSTPYTGILQGICAETSTAPE